MKTETEASYKEPGKPVEIFALKVLKSSKLKPLERFQLETFKKFFFGENIEIIGSMKQKRQLAFLLRESCPPTFPDANRFEYCLVDNQNSGAHKLRAVRWIWNFLKQLNVCDRHLNVCI